ncbi:uncharacterized protein BO88DRAFT_407030 [Aspergillus vadensis CBS 113365]|uniref:Uncharacterized protein n=1 Tax=Aspergillus vadensis (strain CBS 113365 / IMI 142717 / IBT 24658) TaxID=1448311 RepID=A0A319B702_ASPVC|nr:hypothetical protein BO88DRAFT_407030 [Aspergillus vadensis CBS 113365]PYH66100.1 hypothetical protein BO88DRAFT_407030 [Aspergillus vadensis CBS 113365]
MEGKGFLPPCVLLASQACSLPLPPPLPPSTPTFTTWLTSIFFHHLEEVAALVIDNGYVTLGFR